MLFRKKMPRSCAYCTHAAKLDEQTVLCTKKGLRSMADKCRRFRYDPTKRIPSTPKALDFEKYNAEDYSL